VSLVQKKSLACLYHVQIKERCFNMSDHCPTKESFMKTMRKRMLADIHRTETPAKMREAILDKIDVCRYRIQHQKRDIIEYEDELAIEHDYALWLKKENPSRRKELKKAIAESNWNIRALEHLMERIWQEMAKTI